MVNYRYSGWESVFVLACAALVIGAGIAGWLKIMFFWGFVAVWAFVVLWAAWGLARLLFGR